MELAKLADFCQAFKSNNLLDMKYIILLFLFFAIESCESSIDRKYIEENLWSYKSGFKVGKGDFISFSKNNIFELKGDSIYYNNKPIAIVKSVDKKNFLMHLKSIDGKEHGIYRNVNEMFD